MYSRALGSLARGVSTSLRPSARPYLLYFKGGYGACIRDVDGNSYLDYAMAWGPLLLGHASKAVNDAIVEQVSQGLTYGAQHHLEYEVAERLTSIITCADQVCLPIAEQRSCR